MLGTFNNWFSNELVYGGGDLGMLKRDALFYFFDPSPFSAVPGLRGYMPAFSSCGGARAPGIQAPGIEARGLCSTGSEVVARGLQLLMARRIVPDQGLSPCSLH